ncbi:MAG: amino acid ABC transporter permease [Hyphomicrobiales bacterium]|nr:amino acid ABC transporter permease [Hyphomicrobiales bacterium]
MTRTFAGLWRHFFGSLGNTLLTLGVLAFGVLLLPPLLRWALIDASFTARTPLECRAAGGACWAIVHEKYRLILFGRFPYAEEWRPLAAMLLIVGLIGSACGGLIPRRALHLAGLLGAAAVALLMWGGVFGLAHVESTNWGGLPLTLILSVSGMTMAFPLAVALALGRRSRLQLVSALCIAFIELLRGVPLVSLLFMASFMLPLFMPGHVQIDELLRALIAIVLFSSAYLAEAIRGGLQGVPATQEEAARSLGLSRTRTTFLVVLPQVLRSAIPGMVNVFIALFKDTSLVGIVGLMDLLLATKQALGDPAWRSFALEAYLFVAALYFGPCYFMSRYSQALERKLGLGDA